MTTLSRRIDTQFSSYCPTVNNNEPSRPRWSSRSSRGTLSCQSSGVSAWGALRSGQNRKLLRHITPQRPPCCSQTHISIDWPPPHVNLPSRLRQPPAVRYRPQIVFVELLYARVAVHMHTRFNASWASWGATLSVLCTACEEGEKQSVTIINNVTLVCWADGC